MKIGILSDLHIDNNANQLQEGENYADLLAGLVNEKDLDVLILAGDIANDHKTSQHFIEELDRLTTAQISFVPGNHDFWTMSASVPNAWDIYDFFKAQTQSLLEQPLLLGNDYAIVGHMGWYDYGYADQDKYDLGDFEKGRFRFAQWKDKAYVHFPESDQEVASIFKDKLVHDLESVKDRSIILVTHVASHPRFVVPRPHRLYDFFNAYLGAASYEDLYQDYPVRYNIMGHSHFRHRIYAEGVHHLSACLGSSRQWLNPGHAASELDNVLKVIHLD